MAKHFDRPSPRPTRPIFMANGEYYFYDEDCFGQKGSSMKYRKKPVVIEAMQLTEKSVFDIYEWMGISGQGNFPGCGHGIDPEDGQFKITTLEDVHIAKINDYIIRGIKGEYYPCKPDIFSATYEEVKE